MTTYNAPVEDMMFLFDNLKDNKNYKEIDKFKEISSDLVKDVLDQAAKINQEIVHPLAKIGDDSPCIYEKHNPYYVIGETGKQKQQAYTLYQEFLIHQMHLQKMYLVLGVQYLARTSLASRVSD